MSPRWTVPALAAALLTALLASPLFAQLPTTEDLNHSRGLSVTSVYQLDDLDAVNLFNGSLTVSIPLGQRFPVNQLDYGFSLHTNSQIWDFDQVTVLGNRETVAEPDSEVSNAGLGWTFSLGRLYAPNTPPVNDTSTTWLLIEGDGSRRKFSDSLHSWGASATSAFAYTRDGSYLRMRKLANNEREVHSPNGTVRTFRTDGRLREIRDPFGNALTVSYDANFLTWTMTDSTGRTHVATFEGDPTDPEIILAHKRKRLKTLDLAAFAGTRALYSFAYRRVLIDRPSKDSSSTTGPQVEVSLLDSITLPDGSAWGITYIETGDDARNIFEQAGAIRSLTLPTLGSYEWEYGLYTFPEESGGVEAGPTPWQTGTGVRFKRVFRRGFGGTSPTQGPLHGAWHYQQGPRSPTQPASTDARETRTWVTDPLGHQTVHYFQNDPADFGYGLPFTKLISDGPRFLSREVFDGAAAVGSRKRSFHLTYTSDDGASRANARVASEATIFHDDGNRRVTVERSGFDGFGHYRTEVRSDTFGVGGVPRRTAFTNFNPTRGTFGTANFTAWPTADPWVLGTFTERTLTEGLTTAKEQFCFEASTGFLQRHRVYRQGTTPTTTDLLSLFVRTARGNVLTEHSYGGDVQTVSTEADLCNLTLPAEDQYRVEHGYHNGARRSTRFLQANGLSLGFFTLDQDLDPNTALPATSRDTAGLATDFEYDALGRRTWIKPRDVSGVERDGWVELIYTPATSTAHAEVEVLQRGTGAETRPVLARGRTLFDGFGRLFQERTTLADSPAGVPIDTSVEARRRIDYNALGQQVRVSETNLASDFVEDTVFADHDPFGRPRQITAPDGATVTLTYAGIRRQDRTTTLGTSLDTATGAVEESAVTQRQIFNRRGQLMRVVEDEGATGHVTDYLYDIGDRLARVTQVRDGVTQTRRFTYDHRGLLLSEQHPEKGALGNGIVELRAYDARGNARRRIDGPDDLTFSYDRAGRLTEVRETGGEERVHKVFTYATASGFSDKRAGKLLTALRHNYIDDFNVDLVVTETYTYAGREGRVSQRHTRVKDPGNPGEGDEYLQTFSYTELGDPATVGYPECLHCPAGVGPERTVSYSYEHGFLKSIPGWASSITYQPNGMIAQLAHANGVVWSQQEDPHHLRRPASILVEGPSGANYLVTGTYRYDGSGNVVGIGADHYLYDRLGRLVEGTTLQAGRGDQQTYQYDGFSNLTAITTTVDGVDTPRTVAANPGTNRLSAAGYDAAGAMTSWGSFLYEREPLGMIRKLTGGGLDLRYAYTADDERILEFDAAAFRSTWRLRDLGGQVIREFRQNAVTGDVTWRRDWIRRNGQPLATDDATQGIRHLHPDHLGNTRVTTDADGALVSAYFFHPYGEIAAALTPGDEVLLYTGHERDGHELAGATGATDDLDYMHARYYNPMVGRFLRVDPVGGSVQVPVSWNLYSYVLARPLSAIDPFGLQSEDPVATFNDSITVVGFVDDANQDLQDFLTLRRLSAAEVNRLSYRPPELQGLSFRQALARIEPGECSGFTCDVIRDLGSGNQVVYALEEGVLGIVGAFSGGAGFSLFGRVASGLGLFGGRTIQGFRLSRHASRRLGQRGISTSMVDTALTKGTRFWDPGRGSVVFISGEGSASVMVAVDPANKAITTAIRGRRVFSSRFQLLVP